MNPEQGQRLKNKFREKLSGETVGVFGYGRTGRAVTKVLMSECKSIRVLEDGDPGGFEQEVQKSPENVEWSFSPEQLPGRMDRLVLSPGVPTDHPLVQQARRQGLPVVGELELAYKLADGKLWCVTGTDGKSTCSELLGAFLSVLNPPSVVCGNRGKPFVEAVAENQNREVNYVVEVSSFQVETMQDFSPDRVLLTNLGDDHQNRHESLEEYHELKWELVERTRDSGRVALPANLRQEWEQRNPGPELDVVYFTEKEADPEAGNLTWTEAGFQTENFRLPAGDLPHLLRCFPQNLLGVVSLLDEFPDARELEESLKRFVAPPHRAEFVVAREGVRVINDSKGTTPSAVESLVEVTDGSFSLLLGGGEKQADFRDLYERLAARAGDLRQIAICGQESLAERLAEQAEDHGLEPRKYEDWESAVKETIRSADSGETVLLSPGGTSFDAFDDYRHRGQKFRRWAREVLGVA